MGLRCHRLTFGTPVACYQHVCQQCQVLLHYDGRGVMRTRLRAGTRGCRPQPPQRAHRRSSSSTGTPTVASWCAEPARMQLYYSICCRLRPSICAHGLQEALHTRRHPRGTAAGLVNNRNLLSRPQPASTETPATISSHMLMRDPAPQARSTASCESPVKTLQLNGLWCGRPSALWGRRTTSRRRCY